MAFSWFPTRLIRRAKAAASPFQETVICRPQLALTRAPRALIRARAASTWAIPSAPFRTGLMNSQPLWFGAVGQMLPSRSAFQPSGSHATCSPWW